MKAIKLLALFMTVALTAGCGTPSTDKKDEASQAGPIDYSIYGLDADNPVVLNVFMHHEGDLPIWDQFNEDNMLPGIIVNPIVSENIGWIETPIERLKSGEIDIIMQSVDQISLIDHIPVELQSNKIPNQLLGQIVRDGDLVGIPSSKIVAGLVYQKALFDEQGWVEPDSISSIIGLLNQAENLGIRGIKLERPFKKGTFTDLLFSNSIYSDEGNRVKEGLACLNSHKNILNFEPLKKLLSHVDSELDYNFSLIDQSHVFKVDYFYAPHYQRNNLGFITMELGRNQYSAILPAPYIISSYTKNEKASQALLNFMTSSKFSQLIVDEARFPLIDGEYEFIKAVIEYPEFKSIYNKIKDQQPVSFTNVSLFNDTALDLSSDEIYSYKYSNRIDYAFDALVSEKITTDQFFSFLQYGINRLNEKWSDHCSADNVEIEGNLQPIPFGVQMGRDSIGWDLVDDLSLPSLLVSEQITASAPSPVLFDYNVSSMTNLDLNSGPIKALTKNLFESNYLDYFHSSYSVENLVAPEINENFQIEMFPTGLVGRDVGKIHSGLELTIPDTFNAEDIVLEIEIEYVNVDSNNGQFSVSHSSEYQYDQLGLFEQQTVIISPTINQFLVYFHDVSYGEDYPDGSLLIKSIVIKNKVTEQSLLNKFSGLNVLKSQYSQDSYIEMFLELRSDGEAMLVDGSITDGKFKKVNINYYYDESLNVLQFELEGKKIFTSNIIDRVLFDFGPLIWNTDNYETSKNFSINRTKKFSNNVVNLFHRAGDLNIWGEGEYNGSSAQYSNAFLLSEIPDQEISLPKISNDETGEVIILLNRSNFLYADSPNSQILYIDSHASEIIGPDQFETVVLEDEMSASRFSVVNSGFGNVVITTNSDSKINYNHIYNNYESGGIMSNTYYYITDSTFDIEFSAVDQENIGKEIDIIFKADDWSTVEITRQ